MHPLTDAFIKGRAKFKKNVGNYFDRDKDPKKACHVGALLWGYDDYHDKKRVIEYPTQHIAGLKAEYPFLAKEGQYVPMPCEDSGQTDGHVLSILIHLNDDHDGRSGWTDQKVAEWLESALQGLSSAQSSIYDRGPE